MASPQVHHRTLLKKIQSFNKQRVFRVAIIGQNGVGKSALTVRFLTRRFIGDYDPYLEKIYTCTRCVMGTNVDYEILDTAGQNENSKLKQHIKWSDAAILMYSVTDRCSFNEVRRLNFTITASSRRKHKNMQGGVEVPTPRTKSRSVVGLNVVHHPTAAFSAVEARKRSATKSETGSDPYQELAWSGSLPVLLVANQSDRVMDRMVSPEEGQLLASELGCVSFAELSVREDIDAVMDVFDDLFLAYRRSTKVKANGGPLSWSMVSMERLALGSVPREKSEGSGQGGEEDGHDVQLSMAVRTRRREALIS